MIRAFRFTVNRFLHAFTGDAHFERMYERLPCSAWGRLFFVDRGFSSTGIVDEISQGGMRFRPAQSYISMRMGDLVRIKVGAYDLEASIVNTTEQGYGLRLKKTISPEDIQNIMSLSYIENIAA